MRSKTISMRFHVYYDDRHKSGVYLISNSIDNRVYVGSARNLRNRYIDHIGSFRRCTNKATRLQAFVLTHSVEVLTFSVLCLCEPEQLLVMEQQYLDFYQSYDKEYGFNTYPFAGSSRGHFASPETKAKLSAGLRERSPEIYARASAALTGRARPDEVRAKISASRKGQNKGIPLSEATRAKISATLKARASNPEYKAKLIKNLKNGSSS